MTDSFSSQVEDDGEPNTALDIAGQAVRDFNHRSQGHMRITRPGWRYAPDAYRSLGELTYLAGGLPQTFQQIIAALRHEVELNLIKVDPGTTYDGDPEAAIEAASIALEHATQAAHQMYRGIADAQSAINAGHSRVAVRRFPVHSRRSPAARKWCITAPSWHLVLLV